MQVLSFRGFRLGFLAHDLPFGIAWADLFIYECSLRNRRTIFSVGDFSFMIRCLGTLAQDMPFGMFPLDSAA